MARATASMVLPTPGGPRNTTLALASAKPRAARSRTLRASRSGWKAKSKPSRPLWWGSPDSLRALWKRRPSRTPTSSSRSRSRLLVRLARWSRSACSRMRVATSSLIEASGETTGMVVGGQSAVGDQYPGGRQLGPAGDAGQLELAGLRLGCGGELAVAGARRDRLGRDAVG